MQKLKLKCLFANEQMKAPAFQFYGDDFVAGTADMTQAEIGAYILLLCRQASRGEIPTDQERLKLIAKGEVSDYVLSKFPQGKNARMETVINQRDEWIKKSKMAGEKSALTRLGSTNPPAKCQPNVNQPPNQTSTKRQPTPQPNANTPTPTPTPITPTKLPATTPTKATNKLLSHEWELANRVEQAMGDQWTNDAGKWIARIRRQYDKTTRVWNEVDLAIREARIGTTPAQYAEQIWKEFK